jgi:hypothetical protein
VGDGYYCYYYYSTYVHIGVQDIEVPYADGYIYKVHAISTSQREERGRWLECIMWLVCMHVHTCITVIRCNTLL